MDVYINPGGFRTALHDEIMIHGEILICAGVLGLLIIA